MALDVNRWLQYAKARLDSAVGQGNRSLDRLEAEREVETADQPWLRADTDAPTLDEARARIEWEAERQRKAAAPATSAPPSTPSMDPAADAAQAQARLDLEAQQRATAARLDQIRRELGVEAPPAEPPPASPPG